MSFGRDNPQCVQSINVAVSVVTGYITEEVNMYREHSVIFYFKSGTGLSLADAPFLFSVQVIETSILID